jgi:hypothetical protein
VGKTLLQKEIEKDAQMKYLKRLSQDHKYNKTPYGTIKNPMIEA